MQYPLTLPPTVRRKKLQKMFKNLIPIALCGHAALIENIQGCMDTQYGAFLNKFRTPYPPK